MRPTRRGASALGTVLTAVAVAGVFESPLSTPHFPRCGTDPHDHASSLYSGGRAAVWAVQDPTVRLTPTYGGENGVPHSSTRKI